MVPQERRFERENRNQSLAMGKIFSWLVGSIPEDMSKMETILASGVCLRDTRFMVIPSFTQPMASAMVPAIMMTGKSTISDEMIFLPMLTDAHLHYPLLSLDKWLLVIVVDEDSHSSFENEYQYENSAQHIDILFVFL